MMRRLRGWFGSNRQDSEVLLSRDEFSRVVHTERRRADRNGSQFAMVEFREKKGIAISAQDRLSGVLQGRLRETDAAGLLMGSRIGVVLPDTEADGAWTFVNAIQQQGEISPDLEVAVHSYPDTNPLPISEDSATDHANDHDSESGQELELLLVSRLPVWKRTLDLVVAPLALVALLPVLLVAAAAIKITSTGPILFRQLRSGRGGKPFSVFKLRTMCLDAESQRNDLLAKNEQDGPAFKIKHDPRITPVGRFLRRSCIDELPQLWNVIKGDMTLVGPRPLPCHETDECQGWERRRLEVTPGLTCIWQVDGGTRVTFAEWMRMDIRYIESRRVGGALMLLWRTGLKVVMQRAST